MSSDNKVKDDTTRPDMGDTMVGFIGGGRMAQALASGFIASGLVKAASITVYDPDPRCIEHMKKLGVTVTDKNTEVVERSSQVWIAVKPNIVAPVLKEVSGCVTQNNLFISIAAGITTPFIEQNLPGGTRVIRVMPNTPCLVGAGAAVVSPGSAVQDGDTRTVQRMMGSVGICELGQDYMMDAITGLSGSGPAFVFTAIEALSDGGVKMGLPRELATKLAAQTMMGAAKMVLESGKHPGQLKDEVCSPGGTTIAGVHHLEKHGYRSALIGAVEAATLRSKELGKTD